MRSHLKLAAASVVVTCAFLAISSRVAQAQSYYWPEGHFDPGNGYAGTQATFIYRFTTTLPPCANYSFETNNLSPAADTILHLVYNNGEVAYNDDYLGTLRSKVTYFVNCGGPSKTVTAYVRARSNGSGGQGGTTFEFFFNGASQGTHALGGYTLASGNVTTNSNDTLETVFVNNGAKQSLLLRLVWSVDHYAFSGVNQTSGVGSASKLAGTTATNERWIIGTPVENTDWGPIRVVRNNVLTGADVDQDKLWDSLEYEACTCYTSGSRTCNGNTIACTGVANKQDTDSDGLRDDWEMIGIEQFDPVVDHLYFPLWGASPIHRDIFVEMDKETSNLALIDESSIGNIAQRFNDLPQVTNFDGFTGIRAHFDVDYPCVNDPLPGIGNDNITRECFDANGTSVPTTPWAAGCADKLSANLRSPERMGTFHWLWALPSGNAGRTRPITGACSHFDNQWSTAVHELGHQLGLDHFGTFAAGRANTKPNYPSLINYAYDYEINGSLANIRFSEGNLAAWPLNPRSLSETTNYGGSANIDFMTARPYQFSVNGAGSRQFDWNRDGDFNSSVRAHVVGEPNRKNFGGIHAPPYVSQQNVAGAPETMQSLGAAYSTSGLDKTFLFANRLSDHLIVFATSVSAVGGWSTWQPITSSPTLSSDSGPAAVTVDDLVYVFGIDGVTGRLRYAQLDGIGAPVDGWEDIELPDTNVVFREVSATAHDGNVYVVARNEIGSGEVWLGSILSGVWSEWTPISIGGAPVLCRSGATPGIAAGPDDRLYLVVADVQQTSRIDGDPATYVYDLSSEVWSDPNVAGFWLDNDNCPINGRISALFRPHRTAAGTPLASGNGSIWIEYTVNCSSTGLDTFYRWTWQKLNASIQSFNMGRWHRTLLGWTEPDAFTTSRCFGDGQGDHNELQGTGPTLVDHPNSLAMFRLHEGSASCPNRVYHVPYADGESTPAVLPTDVNDNVVIRDALCTSVHVFETCKCTNFNSACASTPEGPEVSCDLE